MLFEKWRIELLNGLEVTGNGQRIDRFRGRTSAELLALLVINSHRFVPREEVAGTIWPDSAPEAGRAGLRTALASLRSRLEPPGTPANTVLLADRVSIRLSPDSFSSDLVTFTAASARAESTRLSPKHLEALLLAVDLYTGELLPGYYSEWILAERSKLHHIYLKHLSDIVAIYRANKQAELAIPFASRLIVDDPCNEDPYLVAMRVGLEAAMPERTLQYYAQLEHTLRQEFDAAPSLIACGLEQTARQMLMQSPVATRAMRTQRAPTMSEEPAVVRPDRDVEEARERSTEFAPVQPVGLPMNLTRFFGRDTDIMHIARMICPENKEATGATKIEPQRLITITGTGGTGKTRLATKIGSMLSAEHSLPVTYVPMADTTDPHRMLDVIARAMKLTAPDDENLLAVIVSEFSSRRHLLILDNLEQLLSLPPIYESPGDTPTMDPAGSTEDSTAADTVRTLLANVPELCCLVTSRQCLSIEGEQEYPLLPLATPDLPATPERLLDFASVKLFVDRAQLSRPEFQLTTRNADIVASICSQLDGLPLAIELAAAWSSSLSPIQIQERLASRFDLLVGRKRGREARHASLRAALDWSFHLLGQNQQRFFRCLSVFRGGWSMEAAGYVCEGTQVMETVASLRDRSLIVLDEATDGPEQVSRFRMLESLREYAAEQMTSELTLEARRRHLEWYVRLTDEACSHWNQPGEQAWLQRVALEEENILAALHFSMVDQNATNITSALSIMGNLSQYWTLRGNYREVRALLDQLLQNPSPEVPLATRSRALNIAGSLAGFQADWTAAKRFYEENLQLLRRMGSINTGSAELCLGNVALETGDMAAAKGMYQGALLSYERAGNTHGVAAGYGALGHIAMLEKDYAKAIEYVVDAVALQRRQENLSGTTHHLKQLGFCYACAGNLAEARFSFAESLEGYRTLKDLRGMAELFTEVADVFPISADSVRLLGAAQSINETVSATPRINEALLARCRAVLGDAGYDLAWQGGRTLMVEQAVELVRAVLTSK